MYESPGSLQHVCLDYICDNIEALCETTQETNEDGTTSQVYRFEDCFFHSNIADMLLEYLNNKNLLTDQTMTLFNSNNASLKHVHISDAPLTKKGLRLLRPHKIVNLDAVGLRNVTVNDLIGCLGEWTLRNLRILNVCNSTFGFTGDDVLVVIAMTQLQNLRILNVSNTELNKHGLDIITDDLHSLESLDISNNPISDIVPVKKCKGHLKSLTMYNLRLSHRDDVIDTLCELEELRHLDISDDSAVQPFVNLAQTKMSVAALLERADCLPHLISLDISGRQVIPQHVIKDFLHRRREFKFIGLSLTKACEYPMFMDKQHVDFISTVTVTGEATEDQLLASLRRYSSRCIYVQQALYHLFALTQGFSEPRIDIIKLIIPAMRHHPMELGVQMAATACIYNLTKAEMGQKVHPHWLATIVNLTMTAMENFPNHQQLQKNALLTLCSDRILQDVTFDRFRCTQLVMDSLCSFRDASMIRMSVAICSILAAKISTTQTSQLGAKPLYMQKLLSIVEEKITEHKTDITMKFTLSALWNLTDESPETCQMFLNEGGLDLFMKVIETFKDLDDDPRIQIETKVLGLVNNLAEVQALRPSLMREDVLNVVHDLLVSEHIDVSYFAAGIVSHLTVEESLSWQECSINQKQILRTLGKSVMNWTQPKQEMVAYRSFCPFFPLLRQVNKPEAQLWALWAIQHVCMKNASRYCPMLREEGGLERIIALSNNPRTDQGVVQLANCVVSIVENGGPTGETDDDEDNDATMAETE